MAASETLTLILKASGAQALGVLDRLSGKLKNIGLSAFSKLAGWAQKGLLALAAAGAAASTAIAVLGAKQEQTRLKLQTLLGSVKYGNALLAQMQEFANVTPFSTNEVVKAGQTLLSFGVAARDVQGELRMIGDVASGTGKNLDELAAIYGKSLIKGKADAETLNQMSEAGIPIIKALASQFGVAESAVYGLAAAGKISGNNIRSAFQSMTNEGGQFSGMMAKQSQTVSGLFSTLYGKIQTIAATFGEQLAPLASTVLNIFIAWTDTVGAMASDGRLVTWFAEVLKVGVEVFGTISKWGATIWQYISAIGEYVWDILKMTYDRVAIAVQAVATVISAVVETLLNTVAQVNNLFSDDKMEVGYTYTAAFAEETMGSFGKALDGSAQFTKKIIGDLSGDGPISNAVDTNAKTDRTIDGIQAKAASAIDDFLKTSQAKIESQNEDAKATDLPGTIASAIVSEMAPDVTTAEDTSTAPNSISGTAEKMQQATDALGRLGLYNTTSATERLDLLRNNLLRQIAEKIASPQPLYQL